MPLTPWLSKWKDFETSTCGKINSSTSRCCKVEDVKFEGPIFLSFTVQIQLFTRLSTNSVCNENFWPQITITRWGSYIGNLVFLYICSGCFPIYFGVYTLIESKEKKDRVRVSTNDAATVEVGGVSFLLLFLTIQWDVYWLWCFSNR